MTSKSIQPMRINFVYPVKHEKQTNMFTNKVKEVAVPFGEAHIFKVDKRIEKDPASKNIVVEEPARYSYCGITRSDIVKEMVDQQYGENDMKPSGTRVCVKCEEAYRNDPRSAWYAFTHGEAIKTL